MAVRTGVVKAVIGLMAICLAAYIVGPPLYWHLMEGLASASATCPSCNCDCDALPLLSIPQVETASVCYDMSWKVLLDDRILKRLWLLSPDYVVDRMLKSRAVFDFIMLPLQCLDFLIDCAKHDPDVSEDTQKNFAELLSEELKLLETEALENQQRADMALLEAKKMTSQYQKEADKCNSGMETCEEAREKAEAALLAQKQVTAMWEQRACQKGWKEGNGRAQS
ncbi:hypothetical protein SASPL_121802 [Salvia splendens]|uniref:Uncharacterized protein n=1 Tax=Salvia splendens TaxID=180675 RepID=A0A8X8XS82_SALSN|nr:hypothetical protein SASPL_121802 [Salvia splendens]